MVAFMSWYSIPPLIDYIAEELEISSEEVYDSNVVAVAATISKFGLTPIWNDSSPASKIFVFLTATSFFFV